MNGLAQDCGNPGALTMELLQSVSKIYIWISYIYKLYIERVNIGSGNGLVPDSTKPLPESVLIYHQWLWDTDLRPTSLEMRYISIPKMTLKNTFAALLSYLPVANELSWIYAPTADTNVYTCDHLWGMNATVSVRTSVYTSSCRTTCRLSVSFGWFSDCLECPHWSVLALKVQHVWTFASVCVNIR